MKNTIKLFGIIALVAVIGFSFAGCVQPEVEDEDEIIIGSPGGDPYYFAPFPMAPSGGPTADLTFTYYAANAAGAGMPPCYYVGKGTAAGNDIVIPNMYNDGTNGNLPVLGIANNGFANATNITSVFIPDGMSNIGGGAFSGCTGLTSVTIPSTVKSIAAGAFQSCTNLSLTWYYHPYHGGFTFDTNNPPQHATKVTKIIFPTGITSITNNVFVGFTGLENIVIPKTITSIGAYAFLNCSTLTKIYYTGDAAQWAAVTKGTNALPQTATVYYYSATQPAANPGNYWRYVSQGSLIEPQLWQ
jgi:hypothetical protein